MPLLVVRHARAGSRRRWEGPDEQRPLSARGLRQAVMLVDVLAPYAPERILSSAYVRCVQTVEPLAAHLGRPIDRADALAEGAATSAVVAIARDVRGSTVALCTHGDVVAALLRALARTDGLQLPGDAPLAKGSTWVLLEQGARFAEARYLPPPG